MGGERSLGVFGVVDALRLESTPSVCKNARKLGDESDMCRHGGKKV